MQDIYIFKDELTVRANIERLYKTHGAHTLEGKRLDLLTNVQILADSSTSTTNQTGTSVDQAKFGSMIGRAVVGGVFLGGTAAAVGAITGKRKSTTNSTSKETLHTKLTAELSFHDGTSMYVLIGSMKSLHWLLSYVNKTPLTDDELILEEKKSFKAVEKDRQAKIAAQQQEALRIKRRDKISSILLVIVYLVIILPLIYISINSYI